MATQQSVDQAVKSICDIMRRGNCAGALQYVPELTWILFLRILDEREEREQHEAEALGVPFRPSLEHPYRWQDWAAPSGPKRKELQEGALGSFFGFVNTNLLPYLKSLKNRPDAGPRQKVISEVMTGVERVRIDTERNFLDVLDKVNEITAETVDPTHVFTLSQVYEGLLLKMGEKGNDGGQFFTPRQVIKAMVQVIAPAVNETVYDPGCGTGGFLAQSYEFVRDRLGQGATAEQLETLKQRTFWGREKENLIYPIALANLVLHGIDRPNLWHGNTLTGMEIYGGLFAGAPGAFDVILTNPPFGGKEGKDAQTNFDYKTSATQALFLQHVILNLKDKGRCGIVLDEGLLFRTNQDAFVKTKQKLLNDCDVWCIVSLPAGVFTAAGAGVKTNLIFFTKGQPTRRIWYYDLTDVKVRKKTPLMLKHFEDFIRLQHAAPKPGEGGPTRADGPLSWTVDMDERKRLAADEARPFKEEARKKAREAGECEDKEQAKALAKESREAAAKAKEIEDAVYDLKAVNPNKKPVVDTRTPEELLDLIEAKGREIAEALAVLRQKKSEGRGVPDLVKPPPFPGAEAQDAVFTIGHSDHSLEQFLRLLKQHGVTAVADVRSSPYSRHVPHFSKDSISAFLTRNGIEYVFLGRELGARRSERSCYVEGRAQYERIAELDVFRDGIQRVVKGAKKYRLALMCTEKDPLSCHRCVLVGKALVETGLLVQHIHADGHLETQGEVEERMIHAVGIEPDLFGGSSDHEALVARAYQEQGLRLAVKEESGTFHTPS